MREHTAPRAEHDGSAYSLRTSCSMRRLGDDILEPVNTGRWIRVSLLLLLVLLVLLVVVVLLLLLFCETSGTHSSTHRSMSASGLPNSGACCGVHVDRKEPRGNERGRERGRNESETGPLGEPLQRERERGSPRPPPERQKNTQTGGARVPATRVPFHGLAC